jgi:hypothetical protein
MNSNLRTLLGVGTIVWIGYILYKNNKQDKLIQEIKNELEDAKNKIETATGQVITELPTRVKETFGMTRPNVDLQIFGDKVSQKYNASKNATVSPAIVNVINEEGLPYEKFQQGM